MRTGSKGHKPNCKCSFCKATRKGLVGDANPSKRPEVRAKISKKLKGRIFTDEWRKKLSESAKKRDPSTRIFSATHRENLRKAILGKPRLDLMGDKNPAKRPEVRQKIKSNHHSKVDPKMYIESGRFGGLNIYASYCLVIGLLILTDWSLSLLTYMLQSIQ